MQIHVHKYFEQNIITIYVSPQIFSNQKIIQQATAK